MSTDTTTNGTTDQLDDGNTIEGGITVVQAPDNALVVTNPDQYAKELFEPFHLELRKAKRQASSKPYEITTPEGLAAAKEFRLTFQKIRTRADKLKAERKKPIDQAGKALLSGFSTLAEAAKAEEDKHAAAIAAEEQRQADERQRKLDEERERVAGLEAKVDAIRMFPSTMTGATSDQLRATIEEWANKALAKADYQEYFEDAVIALEGTVNELRKMLELAVQREEAARKAEADRLELERLRAEQAQRDAAALENARQLEAQQAALAKQQQTMNDIQAINQRGLVDGDARTLHRALVDVQAIVVDEATFGGMASMAQMAKDMAANALNQRYQARLALELEEAHAQALDEDAEREALAGQAARTAAAIAAEPAPQRRAFHSFGMGGTRSFSAGADQVDPLATPAAPVKPQRPADILTVLAKHYNQPETLVREWLVDLVRDFAL